MPPFPPARGRPLPRAWGSGTWVGTTDAPPSGRRGARVHSASGSWRGGDKPPGTGVVRGLLDHGAGPVYGRPGRPRRTRSPAHPSGVGFRRGLAHPLPPGAGAGTAPADRSSPTPPAGDERSLRYGGVYAGRGRARCHPTVLDVVVQPGGSPGGSRAGPAVPLFRRPSVTGVL